MNPARVDKEDERRMVPCRNFVNGYCPRGTKCKFPHPADVTALPPFMRVPNLPQGFRQSNFGQYPVRPAAGGPNSMFSLRQGPRPRYGDSLRYGDSPRYGAISGRSPLGGMGGGLRVGGFGSRPYSAVSPRVQGIGGIRPPLVPGPRVQGAGYPIQFRERIKYGGGGGGNYARGAPVLPAPAYHYEMDGKGVEFQKEHERRASAPPAPTRENQGYQNTVFTHIDWERYVNPGARPPPPTRVPFVESGSSRSMKTQHAAGKAEMEAGGGQAEADMQSFFSERMAAEPSKGRPPIPPKMRDCVPMMKSSKSLNAKLELQKKVRQIAKELSGESGETMEVLFKKLSFEPKPASEEQDMMVKGSCDDKNEASDNVAGTSAASTGQPVETGTACEPNGAFSGTSALANSGARLDAGDSAAIAASTVGNVAKAEDEDSAEEKTKELPK